MREWFRVWDTSLRRQLVMATGLWKVSGILRVGQRECQDLGAEKQVFVPSALCLWDLSCQDRCRPMLNPGIGATIFIIRNYLLIKLDSLEICIHSFD